MVQILLHLLYVPALEEALYRNHMVFEIMADAALLVEGEARFIRFNMACFGKMLTVTVDNGFNGTVKMEAGRYLSTKDQHVIIWCLRSWRIRRVASILLLIRRYCST